MAVSTPEGHGREEVEVVLAVEQFVSEKRPPVSAVAFTLQLGEALHRYGTPAHRLEEHLEMVARQLGLEARFFSTPTSIFASFGPPEALHTSLIRVEPGDLDLGRLAKLDALADDVVRGHLPPEEGSKRVAAILAEPPRSGLVSRLLSWALVAAAGAWLFGGGPKEAAVAGTSSLLIGGLEAWTKREPRRFLMLELVAALLATALSVVTASLFGPLSIQVATLAGVIVLLPGLSLTVAITELATRNLISGASRLVGAALVFLQLGFGVALGTRLTQLLPPLLPALRLPHSLWTEILALLVATLAVSVLFRAQREDWLWIGLSGALAFCGARLGAQWLGAELGAFLGALVVGTASNALSRGRQRPAIITVVPGIMLLVPGSLGFRSLESLMARDVVAGVDTAFSMLMVAVALVTGLLFANAVVSPRRVL